MNRWGLNMTPGRIAKKKTGKNTKKARPFDVLKSLNRRGRCETRHRVRGAEPIRGGLLSHKRAFICACVTGIVFSTQSYADDPAPRYEFRVVEEGLGEALDAFVKLTNARLIYPEELARNGRVNPVYGQYTLEEALEVLLSSTEFSGGLTESGVIVISLNNGQSRENIVANGDIKKGLLASVSAVLAGASGAYAQDGVETRDRARQDADTIVVTAQRREQDIKDVPQSVFALGEQQLREARIENLDDLGLSVPGLSVVDFGGIGQQRIYLRGLGNLIGDPLVGVFLDDTPTVTSGVDNLNFRTYDLNRVEVLRGPQGTLYGQGSVGGAIRFITNAPQLDRFEGRVDASASFTEEGAPSQDLKGVVNIPLIEDKLGIRVSGVFENAGGWVDQPTAGKDDVNDETTTSIRTKVLFQPTDRLSLLGTVSVFRLDAGLQSTDGLGNIENKEFVQVFGLQSTPSVEQDYEIYSLNASYDFGPAQIVSITSYVDLETVVRNTLLGPNGFGFGVNAREDVDRFASNFTQELRLSSDDASKLQWLIGGIYTEVERGAGFVFDLGPTEGPSESVFTRNVNPTETEVTSESWSVFGETSYEFAGRLELGAGFRYFEDDLDDRGRTETFTNFSPRGFIKYRLSDDVNIYASAGRGFRSGGFSRGNPYDPETTWSYDLGAKGFLLDGRIDFDVAAFFNEIDNFQIFSSVPGEPAAVIVNGGVAEVIGVEWNIGAQLTDRFFINAHGTALDAELVESDFPGQPLNVGDTLSLVPELQFGFDASYAFDFQDRPGNILLTYNQRNEIRQVTRNSLFGRDDKSGIINMLNLNVNWDFSDSIRFGFFATNLLNDDDFPTAENDQSVIFDTLTGAGASGTGLAGALPPRPRTYGVSIGVEF